MRPCYSLIPQKWWLLVVGDGNCYRFLNGDGCGGWLVAGRYCSISVVIGAGGLHWWWHVMSVSDGRWWDY